MSYSVSGSITCDLQESNRINKSKQRKHKNKSKEEAWGIKTDKYRNKKDVKKDTNDE